MLVLFDCWWLLFCDLMFRLGYVVCLFTFLVAWCWLYSVLCFALMLVGWLEWVVFCGFGFGVDLTCVVV